MPEEIELKLAIAPEDVARFRRQPLLRSLRQGHATTKHLINTYFDTTTLRLQQNRIALRIRQAGRQRIQTIKRDALPGQSGLVRGEWEHPVLEDTPDLTQVDDAELRKVLVPRRGKLALKPIFVTDFRRTAWLLKTTDAEVECALDLGMIRAGKASQPICEVELELKAGNRNVLFALAQQLNRAVPLRPEQASKAARGYALAAGEKPGPVFSQPIVLDVAMTAQTAFAAIAQACVGHALANVAGAQQAGDAEYVHQLRVGIRRLRGAFSVFRKVVPAEDRQLLSTELRWLLQELGPAREWDVFLQETLAPLMKRFHAREGLQRLKAVAETHRASGYDRACKALRSSRCGELFLQMEGWLDAWSRQNQIAEASEENPLHLPVNKLAAEILEDRHKKVTRLGRKIRKLDATELHQLRIEIKKLRYATEFFHAVWPKRASERYIAALKDLQNVLGAMNDAAVATEQIEQLEGEAGTGVEREAGLLLGWISAHLRHGRKDLLGMWEHFAKLEPFW
ncbi:MAG: CYTH and CHAD domain-containing protein [Acidobacteriaceae bacterium]